MRVGRGKADLRPLTIERRVLDHAEGSALVSLGRTRVLCAATVEEKLPSHLLGKQQGWITAEYAMLPRATQERTQRERKNGVAGRTQEIQRLIGRSLRASADLRLLPGRTITLDCDVLQADGGTRVTAIIGSYVALFDALNGLLNRGAIDEWPLLHRIGAISVGVVDGEMFLDLDYIEDSRAAVDLNMVATAKGDVIEVQGTAEQGPVSRQVLDDLLDLGILGVLEIIERVDAVLR
ncbi:MAG: ribonuclease PH [Deinococcus sp.]|nr:ribonuclease PH [Deinococcus sp.]